MTTARVVVLGSRGAFTAAAVATLVERGVVVGLGVAGPAGAPRRLGGRPSLVPADPPSALDHAQAAGIPVLELGGVGADVRSALEALRPDVLVTACFPRLIPVEIRHVATRAFINIHPSLLPEYRGPTPLFWQFRGAAPGGVTVHHLDGGVDTGDVIAQAPIPYPSGIRTHEAEVLAASTGARLLADLLARDGEWPRGAQATGEAARAFPPRRRASSPVPGPPAGHSISSAAPAPGARSSYKASRVMSTTRSGWRRRALWWATASAWSRSRMRPCTSSDRCPRPRPAVERA